MTVSEYRDKFAQLSRYAPNEVADDADKQRHFLKGLYDGLQLQLMSNTYPNFLALVNRAIVIDNKHREMDAKRKRLQGQTSGSNTRQHSNPQQGSQQRYQGPSYQWNRNPNQQQPQYQQQNGNQRSQQQIDGQTPRQGNPNNTPVKNSPSSNPNVCYHCGEVGHYANHCPRKQNQLAPQNQNSN